MSFHIPDHYSQLDTVIAFALASYLIQEGHEATRQQLAQREPR